MWPAIMFAKRRMASANGLTNAPMISSGDEQDQQRPRHVRDEVLQVVPDALLADARRRG